MAVTKAQRRLLAELEAGQVLVRSFDVYGGYWWWLRPTQAKVNKATVAALEHAKIIVMGQPQRVYSGYQEATYAVASKQEGGR